MKNEELTKRELYPIFSVLTRCKSIDTSNLRSVFLHIKQLNMKAEKLNGEKKDIDKFKKELKMLSDQVDKILPTVDFSTNMKFKVRVNTNIDKIVEELSPIEKEEKALYSDEYREYEKKLRDLKVNYAKKDKDGKVKYYDPPMNKTPIIEERNQKKLDSEVKALEEEYKVAIKLVEDGLKQKEQALDGKSKIEFKKININHLPDYLSTDALNVLMPLIDDEED